MVDKKQEKAKRTTRESNMPMHTMRDGSVMPGRTHKEYLKEYEKKGKK